MPRRRMCGSVEHSDIFVTESAHYANDIQQHSTKLCKEELEKIASHIHLADWTFSVAAIEKKKKTKKTEFYVSLGVFLLTADNAQSH